MSENNRKRIDRLYEPEIVPWRQAWSQFWDEAWRSITEHELELAAAFGEHDEERLDEADARLLERCPPLAGYALDEAWQDWLERIETVLKKAVPGGSLPAGSDRPLSEMRRADLSTWPRSLPVPPVEPEGLWEYLKAVTGEAEREGVITGCASAITLSYLAMARAIRAVRR